MLGAQLGVLVFDPSEDCVEDDLLGGDVELVVVYEVENLEIEFVVKKWNNCTEYLIFDSIDNVSILQDSIISLIQLEYNIVII